VTLAALEAPTSAPDSEAAATAVIYLRVSSDSQVSKAHDPEGYSIPTQREGCQRHAERLEARVIGEFVELGRTGTNLRRPALQDMLAALPKLKPTYVIFYDLSRVAREEQDAFWLLGEIKRHGAKLESTLERIDDSPTGLLLYTIMTGVNAHRSRMDGEKVKGGLQRKHADGGSMGPARIGYLNDTETIEGRKIATISVDDARVELVRLGFSLASNGAHTLTTITEVLEEAGLRTRATRKRPSKPMSRSMVHRMLREDYYVGIVTLKGAKRRGRHTAIIDPETFAKVQQVLDAHRASGDRSHKHSHYLVGSQLRCKHCGTRLGYSRNRGNGGVYEYFTCLSRVSMQGSCGALYFRAHLVERAIERKYKTYLITPEQQAVIREVLHAHAETSRKVARDDAARHERRVRELISQQQKLLDLYYDDGVSKEVLQAEQKRIETEQRAIEKLAAAARYEVAELDQALDDALLLIDTRVAPYLSGNPTERRLINLAIYTALLVSGADTIRAEATPLYAQLGPLARRLAPEASRASRPKNAHGPVFRGHGAKSLQMAEREGFEPSNEVAPVTRFPVAPVQPLRHLSRRLFVDLRSTAASPRLRHLRLQRC
jgi:site-specific DNA recombinase